MDSPEKMQDQLNKISKVVSPDKPKEPVKKNGHTIHMKYSPFEDVPLGERRCGECGKLFPKKEFRKGDLGSGYYYRCKDCREFNKVYNNNKKEVKYGRRKKS